MLTVDRAREVLSYDTETGIFRWKTRLGTRGAPGAIAGHLNAEGYWHIQIDGRKYLGHRLAWLIVTGEWPSDELDHCDLNKANNCWRNLRPATHLQNMFNQAARSHNRTGFKGVSERPNGKFQAMIMTKGQAQYLGVFQTADEAAEAYARASTTASTTQHAEFGRTRA
jgi:hypothetical protein